MTIEEKNNYIKEYIKGIAEKNPDIFTKEVIQRAIEKFKDNEESLEVLIPKIELTANNFLKKNIEQKKYLQTMSEKFKGSDYQATNIDDLDISTLTYSQMDNLFFHYSWKKYLESYDNNGMKPAIGENSKGIDPEASIFFSKGVEGVLELWDVWLKWRLNRQNNPQYEGNTPDEIQDTINRFSLGHITEEERNNWYYWMSYFKDKQYLENNSMLEKLFEYQYNEMINSDYLILDLKEKEEYKYDQIDIKKLREIEKAKKTGKGINPLTLAQYGSYSDFSTPIIDKWNMQTIPGKNIVIEPNRIKRINIYGKTDVYSIMKFMYDKYKKEIPEEKQVKFDILDEYIKYVEQKKINADIKNDESLNKNKNDNFQNTFTAQQVNTQIENKQLFQQQINNTKFESIEAPKKTESFTQRSKSEIQVYQQIKEKNKIIKQQKILKKQAEKQKVKTLTQSSPKGSGPNSNKGFTNIIMLSLIVIFVSVTLFTFVYMIIGR